MNTHHDHQHSEACSHDHQSKIPTRQILTKEDLERFKTSPAHDQYISFLHQLNDSIKNVPLTFSTKKSQGVLNVLSVLEVLKGWVDEIKPVDVGLSRFGNQAFQTWYDKLSDSKMELLEFIPEFYRLEIATYLQESFGNRKRIDFGTGHEAHFICFLFCLFKIHVFEKDDLQAIVLNVFWCYINLTRKLQFVYWLEPAGSHGVWGLDDYHFLPFLFGSAQLYDHKYLRPKSIHDSFILEDMSQDYMYFSMIRYINSIKTESLRWHSPMLDDISGVKKWQKVNEGMFKMYEAEVLQKLPIMQHFLFGSLIEFEGTGEFKEEMEHVHAMGQEHPTCCGMRIPSAVAASSLKHRIPFD